MKRQKEKPKRKTEKKNRKKSAEKSQKMGSRKPKISHLKAKKGNPRRKVNSGSLPY